LSYYGLIKPYSIPEPQNQHELSETNKLNQPFTHEIQVVNYQAKNTTDHDKRTQETDIKKKVVSSVIELRVLIVKIMSEKNASEYATVTRV